MNIIVEMLTSLGSISTTSTKGLSTTSNCNSNMTKQVPEDNSALCLSNKLTVPICLHYFAQTGIRSKSSVTSKKSPIVYKKWPKTDFTRKMKDFDNFKKLPKMWLFGQNNCCHSLRKVGQSAINRPIWSHCLSLTLKQDLIHLLFAFKK